MSKVGIIGFASLRMMPYLYKYTNILDNTSIQYDVFSWDRNGCDVEKEFKGNNIVFRENIHNKKFFLTKIGSFYRYGLFLKKHIEANNYDKLIVLTSQSAFVLKKLLLGKYKDKYIYDYRDITKEGVIPFYRSIIVKMLKNASMVSISSFGFLKKLKIKTMDKMVFSHNLIINDLKKNFFYKNNGKYNNKEMINIAFWGMVRQLKFNTKVCKLFKNRPDIRLHYYGAGCGKEIMDYCYKHSISNVSYHGPYNRKEIEKFAKKTDILCCLYANDRVMKNALQVKLYDGIRFNLPLIVTANSYVANYTSNCNSVFKIDFNDKEIVEKMILWYSNLNSKLVEKEYSTLRQRIVEDEKTFEKRVLIFLNKKNDK